MDIQLQLTFKTGRFKHSENIQKYHFLNLMGMLAKRSLNIFLLVRYIVGKYAYSDGANFFSHFIHHLGFIFLLNLLQCIMGLITP